MSHAAGTTIPNPLIAASLHYARRGKNQWWRYLATPILGIVFSGLLIAALMIALSFVHLMPPDFAKEMTHPSNPLVFFLGTGLGFGAILVGFLIAIGLVHGKSLRDLVGLWRWNEFAIAGGVWLVLLAVATLTDFALAPDGFRFSANSTTAVLTLCALCALPIQTFAEEVVFRGYLTQGLLLATKNPPIAALLAGLLFGALHIPNGIPQAIGAAAFGYATSLIAIRRGGIAFTFGLHLVNNLAGAVVVVSSSDVFAGAPGLITQTTPNLIGWDVAVEFLALAGVLWLALSRAPPKASGDRSPSS